MTGTTPSHTYANFGTYLICVEARDVSGCVLVACATISIDSAGNFSRNTAFTINTLQPIVDIQSGVEATIQDELNIQLYPNPTHSNAILAIHSNTNEKATINIIDLNGHVLSSQQANVTTGNQIINLNLSKFNEGLYIVQYQGKTNTQNFKLIKN